MAPIASSPEKSATSATLARAQPFLSSLYRIPQPVWCRAPAILASYKRGAPRAHSRGERKRYGLFVPSAVPAPTATPYEVNRSPRGADSRTCKRLLNAIYGLASRHQCCEDHCHLCGNCRAPLCSRTGKATGRAILQDLRDQPGGADLHACARVGMSPFLTLACALRERHQASGECANATSFN
jgi:hypothetical protein